MSRLWLKVLIVSLAGLECAFWLFSGYVTWTVRNLVFPPQQPQVTNNTQFAVVLLAAGAVNLVALTAYMLGKQGWFVVLLAITQVANVMLSLWASIAMGNAGWLALGGLPGAVTLALIVMAQRLMPVATVGQVMGR